MSELPRHEPETIIPVIPETPPITGYEITPPIGEIAESVPSLVGLYRFITAFRLAYTEETLHRREASDHVITAASEGARNIRSFNSGPEELDVVPITPIQRAIALHRQGQVRKITKAGLERWRINQVYGTKPEASQEKPQPTVDSPTSPAKKPYPSDAETWAKSHEKIAINDLGKTNDLGSDAHKRRLHGTLEERQPMRGYQRRNETQVAANLSRKGKLIDRNNRRLDKGKEGETRPAKIRRRLIERAETRRGKLQTRLEELRRLAKTR